MSSFTQRNMFDVLDVADVPEHEYEEEEIEVETKPVLSSSSTSAPLSKSAKKRAAKKRNATPTNEAAVPAPKSAAADAIAVNGNGTKAKQVKPVEAGEKVVAAAKAAAGVVVENVKNIAEPTKHTPEDSKYATSEARNQQDLASTPAPLRRETSPPSTILFKPDLPESLPQPTGNQLPSNRKRKTPQDFTPAGPGEVATAQSPNKNSVKFEDGVVPGEGKDGEKTISAKEELPVAQAIGAPKKNQNAIERTVWTFIMIFGFIGLLMMGHPYMILLVLVCQAIVYKEVTDLFDLRDPGAGQRKYNRGEKGDWSKTLNWYFFVSCNYYLYGESIIYYFKHIVFVDAYFIPFAKNHRFISFMLYMIGFVGFVANLQRQHLRQQFALFCWVHITLLIVVVSSHFIVNNILEGLIWFFVPASLVICNDIFAYICGKTFGRTPLIKLSPKKTVEGFFGAFICTLLFGLGWGAFFMRFNYMICPAVDLGVNAFSHIQCKPNPVFLPADFEITGPIRRILETILGHAPPTIAFPPFLLHVLVMATFASLVAPFGGFFASGFKRAFNIKDFGHSIPGHGGMTDRMDCQFLMGLFAYVYYSSVIRIQNISVGSIMQTVVVSLTTAEQLELLDDLKRFLEGQGVRT